MNQRQFRNYFELNANVNKSYQLWAAAKFMEMLWPWINTLEKRKDEKPNALVIQLKKLQNE